MNEDKKNLTKTLDEFLAKTAEQDCTNGSCVIKTDKSLIERINKKVITDDGRQLLT